MGRYQLSNYIIIEKKDQDKIFTKNDQIMFKENFLTQENNEKNRILKEIDKRRGAKKQVEMIIKIKASSSLDFSQ